MIMRRTGFLFAILFCFKRVPSCQAKNVNRFNFGDLDLGNYHPPNNILDDLDLVIDADTSEFFKLNINTKGYPPLSSVKYYPWDYIVEPYRITELKVPGVLYSEKYSYKWIIREPDSKETHVLEGHSVEYMFTKVSEVYDVSVITVHDTIVKHSETYHLMCKYVRREIRTLLDEDRESYFQALAVVAQGNPTAFDAEKILDPSQKSFQYFMVKHIHFGQCSPFHNANSFFTGHNAFTLELDQALQAYDPSVIQPYWDYTIDSGIYGNDWYLDSPVFRDDWFGAASPMNDDKHVTTTWLERIDNPISFDAPVHSSFGIVTTITNENPSLSVTRTHSLCGLETRIPLPGCYEMKGCLQTKTLSDLRICLEGQLHRDLHMSFGGVWDCHTDLSVFADKWPETKFLLAKLGMKTVTLMNVFWVSKFLKCPLHCSFGTRFENCRCTCPMLDRKIEERGGHIDWTDAYDFIAKADNLIPKFDGYLTEEPVVGDDGVERYLFDGVSEEASHALWKVILDMACHPGRFGNMCTGASPGDPLFWPIHPVFDRISMFMRLNPDGKFDDFDWTWVDIEGDCYGHNSADSLPFYNLFGEENKVGRHYYTNNELMILFDPKNPELPYVYDNFDWPHCAPEGASALQ